MHSFRFYVCNWSKLSAATLRGPRSFRPRGPAALQYVPHRQYSKDVRPFSSNSTRSKDKQSEDESKVSTSSEEPPKPSNGKRSRASNPEKSTLRKVAVEAQRKRLRARTGIRDMETKKVTAYCAAESYNIEKVLRLVKAEGHELDPYQTGLFPQVVHIRVNNALESKDTGDLFVFPSGTVVAWNVQEKLAFKLVNKTLVPAAEGTELEEMEIEDMAYIENPQTSTSDVSGDTIVLGTGGEEDHRSMALMAHLDGQSFPTQEVDAVLAKIAFSSGLARSTKLAVLEGLLNNYFESTRSIPTVLSRGSRLRFSRRFILMKTGELLNIRAQLNLYSELTDALPDLFWDSRHDLGLEDYYTKVGRALDVSVRIKSLNDKLTYAQEIAQVLSSRLEEKHGHTLEWIIIVLIAFEILLELRRLWKEHQEVSEPESLENLLRSYLSGKTKLVKEEQNKE
ncbi:YagE family protein [Phyllosticta citriasiana]|uniref:YagE family protein n=1 Tax=Phyllosticta citriasiana TaxID=595635 RepID=A0ABR1KW49_9PEZI